MVEVKNLSISFNIENKTIKAVDDISFKIKKGEILGLVGESGSGKTVTGMSIARLLPMPPAIINSGEIFFKNKNILSLSLKELYKIRGKEIGIIFQEPMTALSPLQKVGRQLVEAIRLHLKDISKSDAMDIAIKWLDKVGIKNPSRRAFDYPFQFSGGMRQRAMIAMALINDPSLIIADEPTTALDVAIQKEIFSLILEMKKDNASILFITHDMGVIWELSDRVVVMKKGKIIEKNETTKLSKSPQEKYTIELISSVSKLDDKPLVNNKTFKFQNNDTLLNIKNLNTWFPVKEGVFSRITSYIKAVNNVSFDIKKGEIFGIVGESGSGKSTIARTILGLEKSQSGDINFLDVTLNNLSYKEFFKYRKELQMIFQDPFSSLNPRMTVIDILTEALLQHKIINSKNRKKYAQDLLDQVHLPKTVLNRYPHEFSGGQRQRLCIARALALKPKFIICDEAVSALDVTTREQIIDLILELNKIHGISYLFISHDISLVRKVCHRIIVMKNGKIIEQGLPDEIIRDPTHNYTKILVDAIPRLTY